MADRTEETVDSEGSSSTTTLSDVLYHMELSGTHLEQPIAIDYDESKISSYLITPQCTPSPAPTPLPRLSPPSRA